MGLYDNPGSCRFLKSPGFKDHAGLHISQRYFIFLHIAAILSGHEWHIFCERWYFLWFMFPVTVFMRHLCGYLSIKQSFMLARSGSQIRWKNNSYHKLCFITTLCKVDIIRRVEIVNPTQHSIHHRNLMMQSYARFPIHELRAQLSKTPALREGCADFVEASN